MISNLIRLKKMHQEKPWLYEEEEHAVLKLAEDAVEFIRQASLREPTDNYLAPERAKAFLEEHK